MSFKDPLILLLIPVVLLVAGWCRRRSLQAGFRFPTLRLVQGVPRTWKIRLSWILPALRVVALILFIVALAGPRSVLEETQTVTEGIDIVLAIDSSGSMAAEDFTIEGRRANRLEVVKNVVKDFVERRPNDRIGLVAFARSAYTVCPLTTDHGWLLSNLERINLGLLEDGTAIGSAISSSLVRLDNSQAKSRIVILLTDGINNAGKIDPLTAAKAAQALGVKVYTIGAATRGYAPFPVKDFWGRQFYQKVKIELDEDLLIEVASLTGGAYFRATDTESLKDIYHEIDKLEKVKIEEFGYKEYRPLFARVLIPALIFLAVEFLLANTVFLKIP